MTHPEVDDQVHSHVHMLGLRTGKEAIPGVQDTELTLGHHGSQVLNEAGSGAVDTPLHHLGKCNDKAMTR